MVERMERRGEEEGGRIGESSHWSKCPNIKEKRSEKT